MLEDYEDLLLSDEVCEILHVSKNSVYALLQSGELKGFQQGRVWKIPKQAVVEYILMKAGMK